MCFINAIFIYMEDEKVIITEEKIVEGVPQKVEEPIFHDDKIFIAANTEKLLNEYTAFKEKLEKLNEGEVAENV